ncbi:hypothetical protein [Synechococcus sp. HBA1120]|nr:hypothetical protein [Synechococcus sp. HBA1120]
MPTRRAVTTITPQRISFAGGGTDLPRYYEANEGSVISSAIDQYIYVTVKKHSKLFKEEFRLSYSKTEHVDDVNKIENGIARECIKLLDIDGPLYISTAADLPASSGLGSSSSFAVGLLHALHTIKGERVSASQLAEEACQVEIECLKNPIGKQDQYAAAFGGLNHFTFKTNGRVIIDHMVIENNLLDYIFDNSLLVWSGVQRDANNILSAQNEKVETRTSQYEILKNDTLRMKEYLLNPDKELLNNVGSMLERSWQIKKGVEETITNEGIEDIHTLIRKNGSLGGKLSGAGGGGFFFEIIPKSKQPKIIEMYGSSRVIKIKHEPLGSRILSEVW